VENHSVNLDQTTRKAALRADPSQQDQAQERLAQLSITAATLKNWLIKREAKLQDLKAQHALLEAEHARLQEQRSDEAEWLLGRAEHFERLVERRNVLISSLIATIRTESKTSIALEAELDRLRRYKASSRMRAKERDNHVDTRVTSNAAVDGLLFILGFTVLGGMFLVYAVKFLS
jgi:hypothetical protein